MFAFSACRLEGEQAAPAAAPAAGVPDNAMKVSVNQNTGQYGYQVGAKAPADLLAAFATKMTAQASDLKKCQESTDKQAEALEATKKATEDARKNAEENKKQEVEAKKKIVVQQETVSLFLQQNQIYSINGLSAIMDEVMYNPQRLLWIDLSTNYLKEIDEDLATAFP